MPNRLARETSPYLRQHADNPVDWYPWCDEALERARIEDKPILLSIGYSACHWCHVMAHESFEDADIAAQMNERFICIKVDREERPDLDKLYQLAHQFITQRPGGWPLTLALDPRTHAPFFAGTYFPPKPRMGMPDFRHVLTQVGDWYQQHKDELGDQGDHLRAAFAQLDPAPDAGLRLGEAPLEEAVKRLRGMHDTANGGFGGAPKFPQTQPLELLLARASASGDDDLRHVVTYSLRRMAEGGLRDPVGGGFYRYTVDERWEIPHFEKMLYDNGALLAVYAQMRAPGADPAFADAAGGIVAWLLREMQAPEGAFYASLDADADGVEGGFYVWDREEVQSLLGPDYELFARRYGLDQAPNFEDRWHLVGRVEPAELARETGADEQSVRARLDAACRSLLEARERRPPPGRDDKILTAWNALAVRGLAAAARALPGLRETCLAACREALDCIRQHLWQDGRLLAVYAQGQAHTPAYLDDYALLLDALLERLQAQWEARDLDFAAQIAETMLAHFEDRERGGFFFTADDQETPLYRLKPWADDAMPAGNGVAARALLRLGSLLAEPRYLDAAERTLRAGWPALSRQPAAHTGLALALHEALAPPALVIARGRDQALASWGEALDTVRGPGQLVFAVPETGDRLPAALADKAAPEDGVRAYVCRGMQCSEPLTEPEALRAALARQA